MKAEIEKFMQYLVIQRNASPMTVKSYKSDLGQFCEFLKDMPIQSIEKDTIRGFVEYCYDTGLSKVTTRRKIFALKSFFKFLYNNDLIANNPAKSISIPKRGNKIPQFLTYKQIKKLLDFPLMEFVDFRDRALLEVFYSTGARTSEIASADITDCDFDGGRLKVHGKGLTERMVFLGDDSLDCLERYLNEREKRFHKLTEPLFVNRNGERITVRSIFNVVTKRAEGVGISGKISPHILRHSFATEMLNRGVDVRWLQEFLGHSSVKTTQTYLHLTKERLKKSYEQYHPHAGELGEYKR